MFTLSRLRFYGQLLEQLHVALLSHHTVVVVVIAQQLFYRQLSRLRKFAVLHIVTVLLWANIFVYSSSKELHLITHQTIRLMGYIGPLTLTLAVRSPDNPLRSMI